MVFMVFKKIKEKKLKSEEVKLKERIVKNSKDIFFLMGFRRRRK